MIEYDFTLRLTMQEAVQVLGALVLVPDDPEAPDPNRVIEKAANSLRDSIRAQKVRAHGP